MSGLAGGLCLNSGRGAHEFWSAAPDAPEGFAAGLEMGTDD